MQLAGMQEEAQEIGAAVERMSNENSTLRTKRGNIDQQIERYQMMTEEFGRQCTGLSDEEAAIARALAALDEEVRTGSSELAALESRLDGANVGINQLTEAVASTKKKLEGTDIPALSEQAGEEEAGGGGGRPPAPEQGGRYHRPAAGTPALHPADRGAEGRAGEGAGKDPASSRRRWQTPGARSRRAMPGSKRSRSGRRSSPGSSRGSRPGERRWPGRSRSRNGGSSSSMW